MVSVRSEICGCVSVGVFEERSEGVGAGGGNFSVMGSCNSWSRGSLLGAGAFGQVNLGMDRVTGSFFAVKSVVVCNQGTPDLGSQNSLVALENEIQMLQGLESEFVVRCLGSDWSEEGGQRMRNVFLEYMPGGSLSDLLKQFAGVQPLDEQLIRSYTRSILQGIDYLHRRGIVHCDIKGKNVLVGNAGSVKLADFGSAKRVDDVELREKFTGHSGAAPGVLKEQDLEVELQDCAVRKVNGTPLWMAPEVVLQKEQGLPSDIWSLGCTVVEMATGRAPWAQIADPFVALYRIGCTNEMPPVPSSLSPEAHDFLAHCFERNPRMRWTSAQLLEHPFLSGVGEARARSDFSHTEMQFPNTPVSPTSVLELDHGSSSDVLSSLANSIPPLSSPRFWKLAAFQSPKARAHSDEASETGSSRNSKDWCGTSPLSPPAEGEWIVVRSPKGNSSPQRKFGSFHERAASEMQCDQATVDPAPKELEVAITSEVILSASTSNAELTKGYHIQELCKSPRVAPVMDSISASSTPASSSSCFSSSISYIPRARNIAVAENLSLEASSSISKVTPISPPDILFKNLYPHPVQIEPEAVANFLSSPVKNQLQSPRFDHTDCRILFWSLVEIRRACFIYFDACGVLMSAIHMHLSRICQISLEKYLQWFSLCNLRSPFQGFLGFYCTESRILNKKLIAIPLKICFLSMCFCVCYQLLQELCLLCCCAFHNLNLQAGFVFCSVY